MKSLAKILLPVDFSERSLGAAHYARTLAERFGSELILLHVLTPPHYEFGALEVGGSMLTELYANRGAQVEKELETFLAGELHGLEARRVVLEGDPARQIVDYAHDQNVGLIVMPTHGYGPFRQFILGSITAKVLHDADCPVWTGVHLEDSPAAGPIALRHILCAVDLGPQSCKTLTWAIEMQKEFGASLTVLHAMPAAPGTHDDGHWRHEIEMAARSDLARLLQRFGAQADLVLDAGDPPKVVCDRAARGHADLLVIGRGSAAGVFGRLRTNAYAIIRQSPCPVSSV
ncbi:MAG: universal stress protein [Bryobacteraceae bacterium]|jgi:nucleotide-binding universal stress UspA family protein